MLTSYKLENPRKLVRALMFVFAVLVATVAPFSANASAERDSPEFEYITVSHGDSLWDLALQHSPGNDPREWIADAVALNGLESAELFMGQQIALP